MIDFFANPKIWQVFSFVIFVSLCLKFLKPMLLALIDARIDSIRKELETAESLRVEAQELLAQYQRKHKDAMQEAKDVVAQAEKHAAQIRKNAEFELVENMDRREQQLKEQLKRMEKAAIMDIRNYASEITIKAAREVIASELDQKDDDQLIKQSVSNLDKHLN